MVASRVVALEFATRDCCSWQSPIVAVQAGLGFQLRVVVVRLPFALPYRVATGVDEHEEPYFLAHRIPQAVSEVSACVLLAFDAIFLHACWGSLVVVGLARCCSMSC